MSHWRIMACTLCLNSSVNYRHWFWNIHKTTFLLSSDSLRDFLLRSLNNFINFPSNCINFRLSIKISPYMVICFNEFFQFFLETIILMIKSSHMLIKSINFRLKINLISKHLISMLFNSFYIIMNGLLILFQFAESYFKFLAF